MAGQIIADLKHTPLLQNAKDWKTWAVPGPGSKRGLNRVLGHDIRANWPNSAFLYALRDLSITIQPKLRIPLSLDMQNLQNCLCEFDKWCRAKDGSGKPKQRYIPTAQRVGH
jgi:hypothetical protein